MNKRIDLVGNKYSYKHGESFTRLYNIWAMMKQRCTNPKAENYPNYGGRGITICPEWTNDYTKFRDWALNNGYKEVLQINRIWNDGNYEPSNCDWVTILENNRNQTKTKLTLRKANEIRELEKTGNYTQKELAEKYNVNQPLISLVINNRIWKNN